MRAVRSRWYQRLGALAFVKAPSVFLKSSTRAPRVRACLWPAGSLGLRDIQIFPASRRPAIDALDPSLQSLQYRAAAILLSHFGCTILPSNLRNRLDRNDFVWAFSSFARDLGLSAQMLTDSYHPFHEQAAHRFRRAITLLAEIDDASAAGELNPDPFFSMLSGDLDRPELACMLALFKNAARVASVLRSTNVLFPVFTEFRKDAEEHLHEWQRLTADELHEISSLTKEYADLQITFHEVIRELESIFGEIGAHEAELGDLRLLVAQMLEDKESTQKQIETGLLPPDQGIRLLIDLLEEIRLVADRVAPGMGWDHDGEADIHERLVDCLSVLDLSPGATIEDIKKAFRKLAKDFHPDISRQPEATEKFRSIKSSYDWLLTNYR